MVADRGYFSGKRFWVRPGRHDPAVAKSLTSNSKATVASTTRLCVNRADDEYRCQPVKRAIKRFTTIEHGMILHKYWSSACPRCPLKRNARRRLRRIARLGNEVVLEAMQERLTSSP